MIVLYVFPQNKRNVLLAYLVLQLMLSEAPPSGPETPPFASQTHLQNRPGHPVSIIYGCINCPGQFVSCYGNQDGTFMCASLLCCLRTEQLPHVHTYVPIHLLSVFSYELQYILLNKSPAFLAAAC